MALQVSYLGKGKGIKAIWEAVDGVDTGAGVDMGGYPDRTVTATGDFGGGTVTIEGSNDGTVWQTLSEPDGTALTFTANGVAVIAESTQYVRQTMAGGAAADVDVIIVGY